MIGLSHRLRDTRVYQEALEEGREEGLAEGLAEGLKESVVEVLSARFGTMPESIAQRLATVTDGAVLKGLLRQAIAVSSITEFAQQLD